MSDLDTRLREALHELAPADPRTDGLAAGARHYAARVRRSQQVALAGATAAALVAAGLVVGSLDKPGRVVPAGRLLAPADCTRQAAQPSVPKADGQNTADVLAAWVCADASAPAVGSTASPSAPGPSAVPAAGWELPRAELTAPQVLPFLIVAGRGTDSECGSYRPGPPFTITLETSGGLLSTFRSRDMACAGVPALASFLAALADEEADARAARSSDGALACRSTESWPSVTSDSGLATPLVAATFCLVPSFMVGDPVRAIQPMAARSYRSLSLTAEVVASLNRDLSDLQHGFRGNGACSGEGGWRYTIMGVTGEGARRMLYTACLDEFFVQSADRVGFIPSPGTTAALRALVPPG